MIHQINPWRLVDLPDLRALGFLVYQQGKSQAAAFDAISQHLRCFALPTGNHCQARIGIFFAKSIQVTLIPSTVRAHGRPEQNHQGILAGEEVTQAYGAALEGFELAIQVHLNLEVTPCRKRPVRNFKHQILVVLLVNKHYPQELGSPVTPDHGVFENHIVKIYIGFGLAQLA
jgi:hypothetical protein